MSNSVEQRLTQCLNSLGDASEYVSHGTADALLPGLEVDGLGLIGLPVSRFQARKLIKIADRAPYGRGEETIVDLEVRRVWQIQPDQLTFHSSEWDGFIDGLVDSVKRELAIEANVQSQLYKLLVYEKGSFFLPHRDSEKTDGMFATLVVCLPSKHQGGSLVVSHEGEEKCIDFDGAESEYKIQYAAFYTDCVHEIKPILKGHRVCLVYNLLLSRKKLMNAPRHSAAVDQVAPLIRRLFESDELLRVGIPMSHDYSEAGLSRFSLKGKDRTLVSVLERVGRRLNYRCYLGLMNYYQLGEADYDSMDYRPRWGRRRSYGWEDEDSFNDDSVGMAYIHEEALAVDHWIDMDDNPMNFGEMRFKKSELVSLGQVTESSFQQQVNEATGNEGVTVERWYRRGLVVLWPEDKHFAMLASEGQTAALAALRDLLDNEQGPNRIERGRRFAAEIIKSWRGPEYRSQLRSHKSNEMLCLLKELKDLELIVAFVEGPFIHDYDGTEGDILAEIARDFAWMPLLKPLIHFISGQKADSERARFLELSKIFETLCSAAEVSDGIQLAFCKKLVRALNSCIEDWDLFKGPKSWRQDSNREGLLERLYFLLSITGEKEILDSLITRVIAKKELYKLHKIVIPSVLEISEWFDEDFCLRESFERLRSYCLSELRSLTKDPIVKPIDWTRDAKIKCQCTDCDTLIQFLRNPTQRVLRYPINKERRYHLHHKIDQYNCDCSHKTMRSGSPYTLVCTKNFASFERNTRKFQLNLRLIAKIEEHMTG